jgi:hypothetical protein
LQDVAVVALNRWFESHARVAAFDPRTQLVTLDTHLLCGDRDSDGRLARYWIENVFEALTEPGQFYFDRAARRARGKKVRGRKPQPPSATPSPKDQYNFTHQS